MIEDTNGPTHQRTPSRSQASKRQFPARATWAEPIPLIKDRVAKENAIAAEKLAEAKRYINTPGSQRDYFQATVS